jgi:porin-like protein
MILDQQMSKSFKFTPTIAYTAQFGNGISATLAIEDASTRRTVIQDDAFSVANTADSLYAAQFMPNFVANLRVDQAWGDAQISGATMQLKCGTGGGVVAPANGSNCFAAGVPVKEKYAVAALAGVNLKTPFIAAGDSFQIEGAWSKGAPDFVGASGNPYQNLTVIAYRTKSQGPIVQLMDAFIDGTGEHLTKSWSLNAQFRHFWTPMIRSTIAYGYFKTKMPIEAANAGYPDYHSHQVTANLIWSPVKQLDLGLEAFMVNTHTDDCGNVNVDCTNSNATASASNGKNSLTYYGGVFRARRDF